MINDYKITAKLLRKKGYRFLSKEDEKIFTEYIQDEFANMIGAATKSIISEETYKKLESAVLNGNQEAATTIIEEYIPDYSKIIDSVWVEINELLSKNLNNVKRTKHYTENKKKFDKKSAETVSSNKNESVEIQMTRPEKK